MKNKFLISALLALSFFSYSGFAEDKSQLWLSVGIGGSHFGPCVYSSIAYSYYNNIISIRYFKADEFVFNVDGVYDKPFLSCKEFGILYGISYPKDINLLSFSAGIGYVSGTDRGNKITYHQFESINISTLGIPFEAKFQITVFGDLNIGGAWFGNINSTKSYTGFILRISVGVL